MSRRSSSRFHTGFSLIELLVSIGIIGVLIALVVPALYGVRGQALQTVTRANLRQSLVAFGAYTDAYDETYPWRPQGGDWIWLNPQRTVGIKPGHFDVSRYWPGLMHIVMPWDEHYQAWLGGGAPHGEHSWNRDDGDPLSYRLSSFFLSHTFLARPKLWTPGETNTEQNLRPSANKTSSRRRARCCSTTGRKRTYGMTPMPTGM